MTRRRRSVLTSLATGSIAVTAGCLFGSDVDPATIGAGEEDEELAPPILGDGEIGVAVFADFGCPACRVFNDEIKPQLIEQYVEDDTIRLVHRDLILGQFEWSQAAANAAWAVNVEAGNDAFWTFIDAIYQHQEEFSDATNGPGALLETIAEETVGLGAQARAAADEGTYDERIVADGALYDQLANQRRTPAVFVAGESVDPDAVGPAIEAAR